jgi:hypothetical protein
MKQLSYGFIFSIISSLLFIPTKKSDYVEGWLIDNNGERTEAAIKLFMYDAKSITYKTSADDKAKLKAKSSDLKEIGLVLGDTTIILHKQQSARHSGLGKFKGNLGEVWMQEIYDTDKVKGYDMIVYESGGRVGTSAFGGPSFAGGKFLTVQYGLKMEGNDYVFYFPIEIWLDRSGSGGTFDTIFKRSLSKYMKDYCADFAAQAKKGNLVYAEFEKALDSINASCE